MNASTPAGLTAAVVFTESYAVTVFSAPAEDVGALLGEVDVLVSRQGRAFHYRLPSVVSGDRALHAGHVLGTLAQDYRRWRVARGDTPSLVRSAPTATAPEDLDRIVRALRWCLGEVVFASFVAEALVELPVEVPMVNETHPFVVDHEPWRRATA